MLKLASRSRTRILLVRARSFCAGKNATGLREGSSTASFFPQGWNFFPAEMPQCQWTFFPTGRGLQPPPRVERSTRGRRVPAQAGYRMSWSIPRHWQMGCSASILQLRTGELHSSSTARPTSPPARWSHSATPACAIGCYRRWGGTLFPFLSLMGLLASDTAFLFELPVWRCRRHRLVRHEHVACMRPEAVSGPIMV